MELVDRDNRALVLCYSRNMNVEIPGCEDAPPVNWTVSVVDDCNIDAASFNPADLIVQTTPLSPDAADSLQINYTLSQDGYVCFEATGNLIAGSYLIITTYQGVAADHGVIVSQNLDLPTVINMPGNLSYQSSDYETEVPVSFAVQLNNDSDENIGSASFTINGPQHHLMMP